MLKIGSPAPAFRLPSTSGGHVALSDLRGKKVVLYFYPKDDTPGCTREACDFRDRSAALREAGAVVLGVSKDSLAAHERFRGKYDLDFELLCDADNAVAKAYGAFGEKTLYGKRTVGTIRSTFLVDERGRVAALWSPVKVDGHAQAVLEALTGAPAADAVKSVGVAGSKKAARRAAPKTGAAKASAAKPGRATAPKATKRPARKA